MRSFFIIFCMAFGLIVIWFFPNIQGYYRFKQYCAREGGLQVYGKVLPNQGWLAAGTDPQDYKTPFYLGKVAFVRYQDATGARFDVYANPNPWPKDPDYVFQAVDESKSALYILKYENELIPNELRLGSNKIIVLSAKDNKKIISYTNVAYSLFLNEPSTEYCSRMPVAGKEISEIIYK
jgi:hypothetical protein